MFKIFILLLIIILYIYYIPVSKKEKLKQIIIEKCESNEEEYLRLQKERFF